jgi:DNA-binding winged helix-turn-helix (wHTH) protein/TolB-like protein
LSANKFKQMPTSKDAKDAGTMPPTATLGQRFMIGDWQVSVAGCTLRHCPGADSPATDSSVSGNDGKLVKITPRSMDVLTWLAAHAGQVISTQELLDAIWRSPIASDHAVHKAIAELRSALGDRAQQPRFIKTIPKRGYTLVAPVRPCPALARSEESSPVAAPVEDARTTATAAPVTNAAAPGGEVWYSRLLATAAALLLIVGVLLIGGNEDASPEAESMLTLAVLPFSTQDFHDDNQILAEGIRESLIHNLSRLSHLQVTALRPEQGALLQGVDPGEHPAISRADHLLHGSVYNINGRLRVIVQLVRGSDGVQEYSEQFDLPLDDIFAVQDEIANNVVSALRVHLDENERSQMRDWGTTNALAYQAFLRAEFYYSQFSPEDFHRAIDYYLSAVELDPDFLNAYAGAATAANNLAVYSSMGKINELYDLVLDMHREISRIDPGSELLDSIHAIKLRMQSANYAQ